MTPKETRTEVQTRVRGDREGREISIFVKPDAASQRAWELANPANRFIPAATNVRIETRTVTYGPWTEVERASR